MKNREPEPVIVSPLMNSRMAAKYLSVSERTLVRLRDSGVVPFIRLGGRILFRRWTLDARLTELEAVQAKGVDNA
ncbi:MAG: helix-turn-helix domain-containing protein [Phycisphaeraceae bacterium]|nr:helix-turn-helix domain-containing protein [Phycisphaeraceae bacterium]